MGFFAAFFFLGGPKLLSFQTLQAEAGALRALAEPGLSFSPEDISQSIF